MASGHLKTDVLFYAQKYIHMRIYMQQKEVHEASQVLQKSDSEMEIGMQDVY